MRARALVVVALFVITTLAPTAPAQGAGGAWAFTLTLEDPTSAELRIEVMARGLASNATLDRVPANMTVEPGGSASLEDGVLHLAPDDGFVRFVYRVPVTREHDRFLLVRLPDVLPGPVSGAADARAPSGWSAVASRAIDGVVAFSADLVVEQREIANTTLRIAATGPPPSDAWTYLARAIPYLALRHAAPPRDLLILHAPGVHETLHAGDAIALPAEGDMERLARAFVRAHQSYRVVEVAPASAAWLREGEERYHALATLLAADLLTASEVDESLTRARAVGDPDATLPRAPAGSTLARQKGLVVVRALDDEIRSASNGTASLADLLLHLENGSRRSDSADVEAAASAVAGSSLAPFFERYVYGSEWPPAAPIAAAPDVVVTALSLAPARVAQGETAFARYEVVNLGTRPGTADVLLLLDGMAAARAPVSLDVGARASGTLGLTSSVTGEHRVSMGAQHAALRVLTPPDVRLDHASIAPDRPVADQAFQLIVYVENAGESPGRVRVEVREDGVLLGRTTDAVVAGGTVDAVTIPMRLGAGRHVLDLALLGDGADALQHEIDIALDAEPTRDAPMPAIWSIGALLAALALTRRVRGRHPR